MIKHALEYLKLGFSVIPCQKNKKAIYAWTDFQHTKPTKEQITQWWTKYPSANIAIICGEVSGVDVIDCDTEEAFQNFNENFLSDSIVTPIVKTPKGYHIYFQHRPGLSNAVRSIAGTDLKTTGGYVISPPSIGSNGNKYSWFNGLSPKDCNPAPMPDFVFDVLKQASLTSVFSKTQSNSSSFIYNISKTVPTDTAIDDLSQLSSANIIPVHHRDALFFHLANHLVKGGMPQDNIQFFLRMFLLNCTEQNQKDPFTEKDIEDKIRSAFDRKEKLERNISQDIRDWVLSSNGQFSSKNIQECLVLSSRKEKKLCSGVLSQLVIDGILERDDKYHGVFRKKSDQAMPSKLKDINEPPVGIWLPFNLHYMVDLFPGNIIGVYGEVESGKTAVLLNIARYNLQLMRVHYFNSETGESEFIKRLKKFDDINFSDWTAFLNHYEVDGDFHDQIKPGPGNLNIVDFLEVHKDFYLVGEMIKKIHDALKGAIAVIAIQKNPGRDEPLGGQRAMEKPRLVMALSHGKMKITKAKNWAEGVTDNPRGKSTDFKLINGWKLLQTTDWLRNV